MNGYGRQFIALFDKRTLGHRQTRKASYSKEQAEDKRDNNNDQTLTWLLGNPKRL